MQKVACYMCSGLVVMVPGAAALRRRSGRSPDRGTAAEPGTVSANPRGNKANNANNNTLIHS